MSVADGAVKGAKEELSSQQLCIYTYGEILSASCRKAKIESPFRFGWDELDSHKRASLAPSAEEVEDGPPRGWFPPSLSNVPANLL